MTRPTGRFRRSDRLLLSRDFQRVGRQGRRVASSDFVMLVAPARHVSGQHPEATRRLGVTASRKVGPAVTRNRVKRRVREWFRISREEFEVDVDIVVIARPGAARLDSECLVGELNELRRKLTRHNG